MNYHILELYQLAALEFVATTKTTMYKEEKAQC